MVYVLLPKNTAYAVSHNPSQGYPIVKHCATFTCEQLKINSNHILFSSSLQEELDLSAPNKAAMLGLPKEKKWQIYCSQVDCYYLVLIVSKFNIEICSQRAAAGAAEGEEGGPGSGGHGGRGRLPGRGGTRSALDTQPEPYIQKVNALAMVSWTC